MLLIHAFAFSASQFVHKKKSPLIYTSSYVLGGIRTRENDLEDNLIRHRGDRGYLPVWRSIRYNTPTHYKKVPRRIG